MHARDLDSMAIIGRGIVQSRLNSKDSIGLSNTYQQLAGSYFFLNAFDSAERYYLLASESFHKIGDRKQAAHTLKQLGINYKSQLRFEKALTANHTAYELFFELQDSVEMSMVSTFLSSLNRVQGNYDLSLEYANKAYDIAILIDDKPMIGLSLIQLGKCYLSIDSYDSAFRLGNESYEVFDTNRIGFGKIDAMELIVESLIGLNEYSDAKVKAKEFLALAISSGKLSAQADARFLLGKIFVLTGRYEEGINQLKEAISYAKRMNYTEKIMKASLLLSIAYERLSLSDYALIHLKKYVSFKDSSYSLEKSKEIEKLQAQYSLKSKQREIEQLETISQLKDLKIQQARDRIILMGLVAISVFVIIFLIYKRKLFRQKLFFAEEKERVQKNRFKAVIDAEEKERKRIAQELHDGLGQILSIARLSISCLDEDEQNKSVQHSLKLIDSAVNETRSISHNMMPNALVSVGLEAALQDLIRNVNLAGGIKAIIEMNKLPILNESKSVAIYRIVQETINNSLKYAEASSLSLKIKSGDELIIEVGDDGKGFDTTNIEKSGGIGWKNIYSRAEMINGNVSVYSKLGKGTSVKITLPINESAQATAS